MAEIIANNLTAWMDKAFCSGLDPDIFAGRTPQYAEIAKSVCEQCEVISLCDDYAEYLGKTAREGWIYAGLTEQERQDRS